MITIFNNDNDFRSIEVTEGNCRLICELYGIDESDVTYDDCIDIDALKLMVFEDNEKYNELKEKSLEKLTHLKSLIENQIKMVKGGKLPNMILDWYETSDLESMIYSDPIHSERAFENSISKECTINLINGIDANNPLTWDDIKANLEDNLNADWSHEYTE